MNRYQPANLAPNCDTMKLNFKCSPGSAAVPMRGLVTHRIVVRFSGRQQAAALFDPSLAKRFGNIEFRSIYSSFSVAARPISMKQASDLPIIFIA